MASPPPPHHHYAPTPPPVPPVEPIHKNTNHLLHLVLTLLTCGLWVFVWIGMYLVTESENKRARAWYQQALVDYNRAYWMWEQQHNRP